MNNVVAIKQSEGGEMGVLCGDELRARVREWVGLRRMAQAGVADEIGMSSGAVSSWMNDNYKGDIPALEAKLRRWVDQQGQRREAAEAVPDAPAWVSTPSGEAVMSGLRHAKLFGDMAVVYGAAGLGKTTAIRRYQRDALNVWVATMTPAMAAMVPAMQEVAAAVGADTSGGGAALFRSVVAKVKRSGGLLVIDEAQHLGVQALDQIRAIHDATAIGIALVGNEQVYAAMNGGRRAEYLDRLHSRIGTWVRLRRVQAGDIEALVSKWPVSGECRKELQGIAAQPGALRILTKVLRLASMHAAALGKQGIEPVHVRSAWGELGGAA